MYNQWISSIMSKIDQSHPSVTKSEIGHSTLDLSSAPETRLADSLYHVNQSGMKANHPLASINSQQEYTNNNQTVDRNLLKKGLTIMQLAVTEPQQQTSVALYAIALNKFISAQQGNMITVV